MVIDAAFQGIDDNEGGDRTLLDVARHAAELVWNEEEAAQHLSDPLDPEFAGAFVAAL